VWARNWLFLTLCASGVAMLGASLSPEPKPLPKKDLYVAQMSTADFRATVARVDEAFRRQWNELGIEPAPRAEDLLIARRLALSLMGTSPSLEEIRVLEATPPEDRLALWLNNILQDPRHHDYLAERLARAFVGVKDGPFLLYRRRRFRAWLSDQFEQRRPYDEIVRALIADTGLTTSQPSTNFVVVTLKPDEKKFNANESELAARVSRAFLGVRIDCAECHDHPFEPWKQADFQGLAAFFAQTRQQFTGLVDGQGEYEVEDRVTGKTRTIAPRVPFAKELLPAEGMRRQRLAAWVTDPGNERFAQATVNRVWALMFGRGLVEPIDDIHPGESPPAALDILARDFREHGYNLQRLIALISATEVFRLDSRADLHDPTHAITPEHEAEWAVFPLRRLRPEQVVGALEQACSLETLNAGSHLVLRIAQLIEENDFIKRYGDAGEEELSNEGGTIPQRLLMMNGTLVKNHTKQNPVLNASTRIAMLASSDAEAVEIAYLAVLARRPTPDEAEHFLKRWKEPKAGSRNQRLEDLYWGLLTSMEFAWNH
jgi:uncharacterized protein DUF1549/uncharacterized protein DUF1553